MYCKEVTQKERLHREEVQKRNHQEKAGKELGLGLTSQSKLSSNSHRLYILRLGLMKTKLWMRPLVQEKFHIISDYS